MGFIKDFTVAVACLSFLADATPMYEFSDFHPLFLGTDDLLDRNDKQQTASTTTPTKFEASI
jgi:hypothetical protein